MCNKEIPLDPYSSVWLTIHDLLVNLRSEFRVFYLDNGSLGGSVEEVKSNLLYLEEAAKEINLFVNHNKSEIICAEEGTKEKMLSFFPNLHPTDPSKVTLLGSPIGGSEAIDIVCMGVEDQPIEIHGGYAGIIAGA